MSWSWFECDVGPETCRELFQKLMNCVKLHHVGNISKGINVFCTLWDNVKLGLFGLITGDKIF